MSSYRKQPGVTNFRKYQAPSSSRLSNSNIENKSYSQSAFNYSYNYQKKPNEERCPLNLTNFRANIIQRDSNIEKPTQSLSPILSYQYSHRVNYSKDFDKKENTKINYFPSPSYSPTKPSQPTVSNEPSSLLSAFQLPKPNESKDPDSYFRPTSYHSKYSSAMANFQYKDDYKPTEYVTKSSSVSTRIMKNIQEQNKNQPQSQIPPQNFDPAANDQQNSGYEYNASLFFAKQALLNGGSNSKQYRNDDINPIDPNQTDQNYDISNTSQSNFNTSQFSLNNNDNNIPTTFYSKSNNDSSYKTSFNFNNNNNNSNDYFSNNNNSKTSFSFSNINSSGNNNNSFDYLKSNQLSNNSNDKENEVVDDDDFLAKLKKSISSSVSGENSNMSTKSSYDPYRKNEERSYTNFSRSENYTNFSTPKKNDSNSLEEEEIIIDIPKKKERPNPVPAQDGNETLDLQAKLSKFRQTISLVRKTEEDYGDMFPNDKKLDDDKNKENKENDNFAFDDQEKSLKDVNNDMLSEPSLIFADSQNQS